VIDAINSIGSKRDSSSGLNIINAKPEVKKSIDEAFPEQVVTQSQGQQIQKVEPVKYESNENTE
jgi:hypothetical protein